MVFWLKPGLVILLSVTVAAEGAQLKQTPLARVISLLKDLSGKLAAEGKEEAAEYDKYACFCKEQADQKQYSMEKSDAIIEGLKADIEELETSRSSLSKDMMRLSLKISDLEDEINNSQKKSDDENKKFLAKAQDLSEAIDACGNGISSLKNSKSQMLNAKVDLIQVTHGLANVIERQPLLSEAPGAIALTSLLEKKDAPKFQYQSNDVIAMLEDLLATFKSMKKSLDEDEHMRNAIFEKETLGLVTEKKFAEKERAGTELIVSAKTEKLQNAKDHMGDEEEDFSADKTFLIQLREECKDKAELFDERSQTRASEMTALAKATAELEQNAVPNYQGNRYLVGLQTGTSDEADKNSRGPVTLVQLGRARGRQTLMDARVLDKVQSFLSDEADHLDSRALSNLAWRVRTTRQSRLSAIQLKSDLEAKGDHFKKVRGLIKDLIQKLKDNADAEHDHKAYCDQVMKKRTDQRDSTNTNIERTAGNLARMRADKSEIEQDTQVLRSQSAELHKGLFEFNELHNEDMKVAEDTIDLCQNGAESVKYALSVLEEFYKPGKAAFVQISTSEALGDVESEVNAPNTFDGKYNGARAESEGIIGILEVILSDFERSGDAAKGEKADLEKKRLEFAKASSDDIKIKKGRIDQNVAALSEVASHINDEENLLADQKKELDETEEALEGYSAECVQSDETWSERAAAREKEIEALKEARDMLEDWRA